jgi:putative phage-type endonuclease
MGWTLLALFFLYRVKTPNHSEKDRGSRFAVNIRHCLRSFSLFYFVSRPIGFGKYILYRKGGTPNERTDKTQGNRTAHHAPAQGKNHPAQFAVSAVQCAPPAQAPLSPAREEGLRMPEHIRQEPKVLVSTENLTEQEWLAYRRQGIGGSDVAAILGISPFRTARDLYDDKLNIASAVDDTGNWVALEMGHLLEPLVAQIFTKKTGLEVFQIKKMFRHPQYPFMLADVDYFVRLPNGKIAILEIKTTNYNAKDHWWKDGEECVPVYYETQGRHYMAVMDMDEIFYCCLYGNNEDEVIIRHLCRDREYEQEMIYLEREFWHDYILTRIPPPYTEDGSLILESLRRRLGAADKTVPAIQLDNDLSATMLRYLRLQEQKQQEETRVKTLDAEMQRLKGQMVAKLNGSCMAMGEYGGTQYTICYNPVSRTGITKDNLQKLKLLHPDIYDEYVTVSESRRFSIKAKAADEAA